MEWQSLSYARSRPIITAFTTGSALRYRRRILGLDLSYLRIIFIRRSSHVWATLTHEGALVPQG